MSYSIAFAHMCLCSKVFSLANQVSRGQLYKMDMQNQLLDNIVGQLGKRLDERPTSSTSPSCKPSRSLEDPSFEELSAEINDNSEYSAPYNANVIQHLIPMSTVKQLEELNALAMKEIKRKYTPIRVSNLFFPRIRSIYLVEINWIIRSYKHFRAPSRFLWSRLCHQTSRPVAPIGWVASWK